ncbi:hypothetical protein [Arthrobacter sp. NPDC057013]
MISLTSTPQGVRSAARHGKSRASASNQQSSVEWTPVRSAAVGAGLGVAA